MIDKVTKKLYTNIKNCCIMIAWSYPNFANFATVLFAMVRNTRIYYHVITV